MDLHSKISSLKKKLLNKAEEASKMGDIKSLGIYSQRLQELESYRNNLDKIYSSLSGIEENMDLSKNTAKINSYVMSNAFKGVNKENLSHKQRSENHRQFFVQECRLKGIKLYQHKGRRLYRTNDNGFVGITFAIEKPNGWFLGLTKEDYNAVVLLCEKDRDILRFIIPKSFYISFLEYYSRSENELKLHIKFQQGEYYLQIPKIGKQRITDYLDNFSCLLNSY